MRTSIEGSLLRSAHQEQPCPSPKPHPTRSGAPRCVNPSIGPRPRAWLEVGRPASLDRRPCAVTRESPRKTGSGRAGRRSWTCDACSMVVRTAGARLRRLAEVAVMQATDFGKLHDPTRLGALDGPDVWRILVEREMRASPVVVGEVAGQDAAQVAC